MSNSETPVPVGGRPAKGERVNIMHRYPQEVIDGIEARAKREGIVSRNDAFIQAALAWGDFPNGSPKVAKEPAPPKVPKSIAAKVKTSARPASKPGALLKAKGPKTPPPSKKAKGRGAAFDKAFAPAVEAEPEEAV